MNRAENFTFRYDLDHFKNLISEGRAMIKAGSSTGWPDTLKVGVAQKNDQDKSRLFDGDIGCDLDFNL